LSVIHLVLQPGSLCASAFVATTNPSLPSQNLQSVTSSAPLTLLRLPLLHQIILLRETGIVALLHATVLLVCKIIFDGNAICNLNVPIIGLHNLENSWERNFERLPMLRQTMPVHDVSEYTKASCITSLLTLFDFHACDHVQTVC
jgi:hypothetical protein